MFGGDETGAVVLDVGSAVSKFGYAGEDTPKCVFPTAVGTLAADEVTGRPAKTYVGAASLPHRPGMSLRSPLDHGIVDDWDALESVWSHGFSQLYVETKAHPVIVCEPPITFTPQRERMAEILFETFQAPALYLARSPVCVGFSQGVATGVVVEMGASSTRACAVYDGHVLQRTMHMSEVGGDVLSLAMHDALKKAGITVTPGYAVNKSPRPASSAAHAEEAMDIDAPATAASAAPTKPAGITAHPSSKWLVTERVLEAVTPSFAAARLLDVLHNMKRDVLEVHETGFDESATLAPVKYELPDGQLLTMTSLRQQLTEMLFRADLAEAYRHIFTTRHTPGFSSLIAAGVTVRAVPDRPERALTAPVLSLTEVIHGALLASQADIRRDLCNHVMLSGGGSLLKGLHVRLHWELLSLIPVAFKPRVIAPQPVEREFAAWIGGSVLASLGTFQQMWFSRVEYEEEGAASVERKCA